MRYNYLIEVQCEDGAREIQCSYTDHCRNERDEIDVRRRAVRNIKRRIERDGDEVLYAWITLMERI